ncbi:hypothetical protein SteCoe_27355 [Stentor coeruleus]|uniref:Uncharacterized protein n=1 Tax=Stentor coeruleus TaxID=5963 RepID=A0A1R2BAP9_9CILI|nr:hypothetical protein SteCoe_27355 [Stentor coeruleus]
MTSNPTLSKQLRDLFREVFTNNCYIENSIITKEESDTIEEIDDNEVLENLKDLIMNLLSFKRDYLNSEKAELVKRTEQFEVMLQKLEAEVRGHIRVEHQLKLHIETSQIQTETLEIEKLKQLTEIKDLQEKLKTLNKTKNDTKNSKEMTEKIAKLEENLRRKDAIINRLEYELVELKTIIQSPRLESENMLFKKIRGKREDEFEEIKQKVEEKTIGLQKLQKFIKEKTVRPGRDRNKVIRKSVNENDIAHYKFVDVKINANIVGKIHMRSTSENVRPRSVGRRPPSR